MSIHFEIKNSGYLHYSGKLLWQSQLKTEKSKNLANTSDQCVKKLKQYSSSICVKILAH